MALPWAAFIQVPADIWLGQRTGRALLGGLGVPGGWGAVLLLACAGRAARSPTAGWWCRVADRGSRGSRGTCAAFRHTRRDVGAGLAGPTARRSC